MPEKPTKKSKVRVVGQDRVQIEFRIDDLIEQLRIDLDRIGPVAACNGCDGCKGAAELGIEAEGR